MICSQLSQKWICGKIRPAVPIKNKVSKKQIMPHKDDNYCQVSMRPVKSKACSDKKCQENQVINMRPMKPEIEIGYPNQQYYTSTEDCEMTRIVNPQDATRKGIMTKTVNLTILCKI